MRRLLTTFRFASVACALVSGALWAQSGAAAPALKVLKIDPPNWYATLPKPMLLVEGEGLTGATFALSDAALRVERTVVSANGHWAQLWLAASPATSETVQLQVTRGAQHVDAPYTFAQPRSANDGLAGFSGKDVMYMVVTDRFADGDLTNDGPLAKSPASSPDAAAERAKVRGWHGGDLRGITQHLDYLQQLGVTTVWPTPVYQNHGPEAYHGYHCTDYYAVDEHYGTLADLQALATQLHARGMKLVLDTVPNHVGPFHPWVHDEPAPGWFHGTLAQHTEAQFNFHALMDPHSSARDRTGTLAGWFVNLLPDMNTEDPAVAKYLRQNVEWWLEQTGADGLRIDTFAFVNRGFWHDYNGELKQLFPNLTEVGEVFDTDPTVTSFFAGGRANTAGDGAIDTMLYTPFDFPVYGAFRSTLAGGSKPLSTIFDTLRADVLYPHPERLVTFFSNHDTARLLSAPGMNVARLKMAYGLLATMRGTPQLYYGDELGMKGGEDPDNRTDMPGGFANLAGNEGRNGFKTESRTGDAKELHDWVQQLMQLRLRTPALQTGAQQELFGDATAIAFLRADASSLQGCAAAPTATRFVVVLNESTLARTVTLPNTGNGLEGCSKYEFVLSSGGPAAAPHVQRTSGEIHLPLGPEQVAVFRVTP